MSPPPVGTTQLSGRNAGIDLVRGISIILVVIHHTALRIPLPKTGLSAILPARLLEGLSWDGYEAVFAFFVVSGYLITSNALTRWSTLARLDLHVFYVRRAARIIPCLIALIAVLSMLDLLKIPNYVIERADQSLPRTIFSALALHLNWYEGHTGYLPGGWDVLWSLSIEEVFYLAFPLLCRTIGRYQTCIPILMGLLALSLPFELNALSHAPETWREKAYIPGFAAIAMGVLAASVVSQVPFPKKRFLIISTGWLGTALIGIIFWGEDLVYQLMGNGTMLVLIFGVGLIMVAFGWGWGRQQMTIGTQWLRSFGLMSYEIYLTHMFVVFSIVGLFHLSGAGLYFGWLWFIPVLSLSWGFGRLVDRFLSLPADRWMRDRLTIPTHGEASASTVV